MAKIKRKIKRPPKAKPKPFPLGGYPVRFPEGNETQMVVRSSFNLNTFRTQKMISGGTIVIEPALYAKSSKGFSVDVIDALLDTENRFLDTVANVGVRVPEEKERYPTTHGWAQITYTEGSPAAQRRIAEHIHKIVSYCEQELSASRIKEVASGQG